VHVLGRVYAMQKDGVHDRESESRWSVGQDTARKSRGTVTRAYLRAATPPGLIARLSQPPAES
jgi:hypothetical protein